MKVEPSVVADLTSPDEARKRAAWSMLVLGASPRLLVIIENRLPQAISHRQTPEDVLQEVIKRAWERRGDMGDPRHGGVYRWIVAIAY
ncbi:MAG: hypothetical protein EXS14_08810 [Planctomycetes bacterium]|nr:hypothetical protein [Planctomycetota bacterium]